MVVYVHIVTGLLDHDTVYPAVWEVSTDSAMKLLSISSEITD